MFSRRKEVSSGSRLKAELQQMGVERVLFLDGEEARKSIGRRYRYSTEERSAWSLDIARLAAEWNSRGHVVIVAAITHVSKTRAAIREMLGRYFEGIFDAQLRSARVVTTKDTIRKHLRESMKTLLESRNHTRNLASMILSWIQTSSTLTHVPRFSPITLPGS